MSVVPRLLLPALVAIFAMLAAQLITPLLGNSAEIGSAHRADLNENLALTGGTFLLGVVLFQLLIKPAKQVWLTAAGVIAALIYGLGQAAAFTLNYFGALQGRPPGFVRPHAAEWSLPERLLIAFGGVTALGAAAFALCIALGCMFIFFRRTPTP